MKLLFSFIILINANCVNGQTDTAYLNLLYQKIRRLQPEGTIYYADKPDKQTLRYQYSTLTLRKFKSFGQNIADSFLIITKDEQRYLITELEKSLKSPLPDKLFENAKRLSSGKIFEFVDRLNRKLYDSVRHLSDSLQALHARRRLMRYWSFLFTNPIYIRNRTIFLQYFMYYNLSSGANYLTFYKKRDGNWVKWITVGGGAW